MKHLEGKTAVITGASGFLGAHLARTLKDRGVEVRAADRSRGPAADRSASC